MLAVSVPVDCVPETAFAPVQPFEAVQDVALVDDQVSVELPPEATDVGFAVSVTVGAGVDAATAIVTAPYAVWPPAAVHVREKRVSAISVPVLEEPLMAFEPVQPPEAVQLAAFVEVQLIVDELPALMLIGAAETVTVGVTTSGGASLSLDCASEPQPANSRSGATSRAAPKARAIGECIRSIPRTVKKQAACSSKLRTNHGGRPYLLLDQAVRFRDAGKRVGICRAHQTARTGGSVGG